MNFLFWRDLGLEVGGVVNDTIFQPNESQTFFLDSLKKPVVTAAENHRPHWFQKRFQQP